MAAIVRMPRRSVMARGIDVAAVSVHRNQQPRHGVHEDHHATGDGQQDEADTDPHGVDAGFPRNGAADTTQDPVVGAAAQTAQLAADVLMPVLAVVAPVLRRSDQCPCRSWADQ